MFTSVLLIQPYARTIWCCMHTAGCPLCAEMEALGGALGGGPGGAGRRLALASVKSVYGHTEGAAGATNRSG
jgi:Beta-ketoacyl synthase, C-terminal domain